MELQHCLHNGVQVPTQRKVIDPSGLTTYYVHSNDLYYYTVVEKYM